MACLPPVLRFSFDSPYLPMTRASSGDRALPTRALMSPMNTVSVLGGLFDRVCCRSTAKLFHCSREVSASGLLLP